MEKRGLAGALTAAGARQDHVIGWADELRLGLLGMVRRVWAPRGVKVVQPLQFERRWCYLCLVVDPRTGRLWWSWTLDMKTESIARTVSLWQAAGITTVVWDNAPAHHAPAVHDQGVALVGLPPYSPELNPAERIFEAVRAHVEGEVYATLEAKYAAAHAFLTALEANPDRVRSIAGWDWITDNLARLPAENTA